MSFEIIEKLKKEISQYKDDTAFEHVGVVTEVGDGIAKISGLSKAYFINSSKRSKFFLTMAAFFILPTPSHIRSGTIAKGFLSLEWQR